MSRQPIPLRIAQEAMTAVRATATFDDAVIAQLHQDRFEELARNLFLFGDVAGLQPRAVCRALGQAENRAQCIFRLAREHGEAGDACMTSGQALERGDFFD